MFPFRLLRINTQKPDTRKRLDSHERRKYCRSTTDQLKKRIDASGRLHETSVRDRNEAVADRHDTSHDQSDFCHKHRFGKNHGVSHDCRYDQASTIFREP